MASTRQQTVFSDTDITRLATGASVTLVGRMVGRAIDALGQIAIARLLGPEAFGLYAIGWTVLQMVGIVVPLGLDKGVIHYGSRFWHTSSSKLKGVLFQSIGLAVLSGLFAGGGLYFSAAWLAEQVFHKPDLVPVLRWFSPALIAYAGLTVATAATTISQRMRYAVSAQDLAQPAANFLLIALFYLKGMELFGAVVAGTGSFVVALILALIYVRRLFPEAFSRHLESPCVVKDLLAFSLPASLAGVLSMYVVRVDRLVIGHFWPAADVGVYQAAARSSILFGVIMSGFMTIFSPIIADLHHNREMKRLDELFKVSTKWGLYSTLPLFLVICFASREIMTVVFGSGYETAALPLAILAVGQLINVGTGAVGLLLIMTGHQSRWFLISAVALFISIGLNWLLIPRLGLVGAALGTVCAVGGLFSAGLLQVKRCLGLWPYDVRYLKGLLATTLAAIALLLLSLFDIGSPALKLLTTLAVSVGVFGFALLLLGLDTEDREFVRLIQLRMGLG